MSDGTEALDDRNTLLPKAPHRLQINEIELVGGGRAVGFFPGLNIVRGDITTGKTTLVRLLRALLGTVPDPLPPEVDQVRALRGRMHLADSEWVVLRPRTTKRDAPVELARREPETGKLDEALRVPATGRDGSYSRFLLDRLSLPAPDMPKARRDPAAGMTTVTATDWLGYCIVTGDELDSQIFGHVNPWRDQKRRWIFELIYGYYDSVTAELNAELRSVELRLAAMESQNEVIDKFLAQTPFGNREHLEQAIAERRQELDDNRNRQADFAASVTAGADVSELRTRVLAATERRDRLQAQAVANRHQLQDLIDLRTQLHSQSARLTRAIVADEWLVDFDFLVCPRCGTGVERHRADAGHCYLCLQPEQLSNAPDVLMVEQDRIASQIAETDDLISSRNGSIATDEGSLRDVERVLVGLSRELDARTAAFVSVRVDTIRLQAAQQATLEADVTRLSEYLALFDRREVSTLEQMELRDQADELRTRIEARSLAGTSADDNVRALEKRLLEYLEALHIPQLGDTLTVKIEGPKWLPVISGRT
ncbi:hypothetical protein ACFVW2_35590, partial [Streptomyces sp. NPDC058171]